MCVCVCVKTTHLPDTIRPVCVCAGCRNPDRFLTSACRALALHPATQRHHNACHFTACCLAANELQASARSGHHGPALPASLQSLPLLPQPVGLRACRWLQTCGCRVSAGPAPRRPLLRLTCAGPAFELRTFSADKGARRGAAGCTLPQGLHAGAQRWARARARVSHLPGQSVALGVECFLLGLLIAPVLQVPGLRAAPGQAAYGGASTEGAHSGVCRSRCWSCSDIRRLPS